MLNIKLQQYYQLHYLARRKKELILEIVGKREDSLEPSPYLETHVDFLGITKRYLMNIDTVDNLLRRVRKVEQFKEISKNG
jgi:hypothetical protein